MGSQRREKRSKGKNCVKRLRNKNPEAKVAGCDGQAWTQAWAIVFKKFRYQCRRRLVMEVANAFNWIYSKTTIQIHPKVYTTISEKRTTKPINVTHKKKRKKSEASKQLEKKERPSRQKPWSPQQPHPQ